MVNKLATITGRRDGARRCPLKILVERIYKAAQAVRVMIVLGTMVACHILWKALVHVWMALARVGRALFWFWRRWYFGLGIFSLLLYFIVRFIGLWSVANGFYVFAIFTCTVLPYAAIIYYRMEQNEDWGREGRWFVPARIVVHSFTALVMFILAFVVVPCDNAAIIIRHGEQIGSRKRRGVDKPFFQ